jgi:UDP-GlcNAc:undecaprenyl-phosphate GlcNAc-1-phosphate transferase
MEPAWIAVLVITAGVISFSMTLVVRALAPRVGLTDRPDGRRKLDQRLTPLGGGLAVYVAMVVVILVLFLVPNPCREGLLRRTRSVLGMLAASGGIVLLGLLDDRFGLRGRHKLLGQVLIALCLALNGLDIDSFALFGWHVNVGFLMIPFTILWLIGAVNAINLLDGMDGMATVLGVILTATFAAIAVTMGQQDIAILALVFTGALLGFAWFNLPPATIFLGDAGSMLIGFFLGMLAIKGAMKGPGTVLLAAPLAIWTLPLLDTTAAILRRRLTGRSIYIPDRGHLHHRLLERLGSNPKVLWFVGGCCAITSAGAMVSVYLRSDLTALLASGAVVMVCIVSGLFGRGEVLLVANRLRKFGRSFLVLRGKDGAAASHSSVHLQGSAHWNELWEALMESAEDLCVHRVALDVNLPHLQEGFSASWEKPCQDDTVLDWRVEMPLMIASETVGCVVVAGKADAEMRRRDILRLLDVCDACDFYLQSIVAQNGKSTSHVPPERLERPAKRRRRERALRG